MHRNKQQTLKQRIDSYRQRAATKKLIFPTAKVHFSTLHEPGQLPFWLREEAKDCEETKAGPHLFAPDQAIRVLQDTGHDFWLFMSDRGLEIRSFYNVPKILTKPSISIRHPYAKAFQSRQEPLSRNWVMWGSLFPKEHFSAHSRIAQAALRRDLPNFVTAEKRITPSTTRTFVQLGPADRLVLDMSGLTISVRFGSHHSTEITTFASEAKAMGSYRTLHTADISTAARRMTQLVKSLSKLDKAALLLERKGFISAAATSFPNACSQPTTTSQFRR